MFVYTRVCCLLDDDRHWESYSGFTHPFTCHRVAARSPPHSKQVVSEQAHNSVQQRSVQPPDLGGFQAHTATHAHAPVRAEGLHCPLVATNATENQEGTGLYCSAATGGLTSDQH